MAGLGCGMADSLAGRVQPAGRLALVTRLRFLDGLCKFSAKLVYKHAIACVALGHTARVQGAPCVTDIKDVELMGRKL